MAPMASKIVLWNARSLLRKSHEFKIYITDLLPLLACVCETWLLPTLTLSFPGYSVYRLDRFPGPGGGLLLLVHASLLNVPLSLTPYPGGVLEFLAIRVALPMGWCSILLCYNPCRDISTPEFSHLFAQLPPPALVLGDLNARHPLWDPHLPRGSINRSGLALHAALISATSLSLLTPPGLPTRYDSTRGGASTLDLCLGGPPFDTATFTTGPYMGSDHVPVIIDLNVPSLSPLPPSRNRWRFTDDGWATFTCAVSQPPDITDTQLPEAVASITTHILSAGRQAFCFGSCSPPNKPRVPWWSESCATVVQDRRSAWNAWRRRPSVALRQRYRRLDAICARTIIAAKRAAWASFCSSLSFTFAPSRTWHFLKAMRGRPVSPSLPLHKDGQVLLHDSDRADFLSNHFRTVLSVPRLLTMGPDLQRNVTEGESLPPPQGLGSPFSPHELSTALSSLPTRKAIGDDGVAYEFLRRLPCTAVDALLYIYNASWISGVFPSQWKSSILLPFPKPGKDPSAPSSYRPICLLSCMGKVLEKLVCTRLSWWIESRHLLPAPLCGFRPGRCTMDVLLQFDLLVREAFREKQYLVAAFLDLQGAFDAASHLAILYKLRCLGITGTPLTWFRSYLSDRSFRVQVGGSLSASCPQARGVPQGSVLSPSLFNVLLIDLPMLPHTTPLVYCDDITLVCRSSSLAGATAWLQTSLDSLTTWATSWGLTINPVKSAHMCFTRRRIPAVPSLRAAGEVIPYTNNRRFLGLVLDGPSLTWKHHVAHLRDACLPRLDLMKSIAGAKWGADRDTLIRYYKVYIQSKIDYGSAVYGSASRTVLARLDVIHHSAIRIALGAFKSSPSLSLLAEAGLLPLARHRSLHDCNWLQKVLLLPSSHPLSVLYQSAGISLPYPSWPGRTYPFLVRALHSCASLGLSPPPPFPTSPISPIPPWATSSFVVDTTFCKDFIKSSHAHLASAFFLEMDYSLYPDHFKIFTDGSFVPHPPSATAAVYFEDLSLCQSWRLGAHHSILAAELVAIYQALSFLLAHLQPQRTVIYSDSKSALHLLLSSYPNVQRPLVYAIQCHLLRLQEVGWSFVFRWIPSHVGIRGNTIVDTAARHAHSHLELLDIPADTSSFPHAVLLRCLTSWDEELGWRLPETFLVPLPLSLRPSTMDQGTNPGSRCGPHPPPHWTHLPCLPSPQAPHGP